MCSATNVKTLGFGMGAGGGGWTFSSSRWGTDSFAGGMTGFWVICRSGGAMVVVVVVNSGIGRLLRGFSSATAAWNFSGGTKEKSKGVSSSLIGGSRACENESRMRMSAAEASDIAGVND